MRITSSKLFFLLILFFSYQQNIFAQTKVVGYLPTYKGLKSNIDTIQLTKLTHLIIAFVNPDVNGGFTNEQTFTCTQSLNGTNLSKNELAHTISKAHKEGVKVLLSLGGAIIPSCSGDWQNLLKDQQRVKLVNNLVSLVNEFQLDGLDIDLESGLLTSIINQENYIPFVRSLSTELEKQNKLLTAATGSYIGGMIPTGSLEYFDFVSIMSYDAIGPTWGNAGVEHSTYKKSKADIGIWQQRGLSKDKLVLGLPFYGYGFGQYSSSYTYKDIFSSFGSKLAAVDVIGKVCAKCDYITFNGVNTIKEKTKLALEQGAGVMIWELTHDNKGENSLLNTVYNTINSKRLTVDELISE